jgi:hypothetical protein
MTVDLNSVYYHDNYQKDLDDESYGFEAINGEHIIDVHASFS